ncbi:hypothetical protein [Maribacter litopenaei]|uniref:hypothetical protein n=1 Tax=Maribacter litopenaei TaxID=2976127 RepID=UPI0030845975
MNSLVTGVRTSIFRTPNSFGSVWRGTTDDGTILIRHPYGVNAGVRAAFPEYIGATYEYKPYDGVKNFFRTGTVTNNSINASVHLKMEKYLTMPALVI